MKKVLVISLCLLFITSIFAFEKGTKNIGGSISYQSQKWNSDTDAASILTIAPHGGYFFIDNLCADLLINFLSMDDGYDDKETGFNFGIGARYFYNNIYGGAGFLMQSNSGESVDDYDGTKYDYNFSANFLNFQLGYLVGLVENVYLDLGFDYSMGMGEYGGDWTGDNEQSLLNFGAGLDIFFK